MKQGTNHTKKPFCGLRLNPSTPRVNRAESLPTARLLQDELNKGNSCSIHTLSNSNVDCLRGEGDALDNNDDGNSQSGPLADTGGSEMIET